MEHFKLVSIKLSKLQAARRQLQTAIRLWFEYGDAVSIHTLAFAAHEVIHTLFRRRGHKDLMLDSSLIKDEHRTEYGRFMKASATFFKHAQRDPDAVHDFNPQLNDLFISMSVAGLLRMNEKMHDLELAFNFWNVVHSPNWFAESEQFPDGKPPIPNLEVWQSLKRPDFLRRYLSIPHSDGTPRLRDV